MSSILEALKKLEEEKAARRSGAGHIVGKVVKGGRGAKRIPKWMLPAGMAAAAAVAVLATFILMGGISNRPETPQRAPSARHPSISAQIGRTPEPAAPSATPPTAPLPAAINGSHPSLPSTGPAREMPVPVVAALPPRRGGETEPRPRNTARAASAPGLPVLQVTGIGWQKEVANRLAIVNGRPVAEGNIIEGAKVEEILPDRVRFSFNDRTFEVAIEAGPGETGEHGKSR